MAMFSSFFTVVAKDAFIGLSGYATGSREPSRENLILLFMVGSLTVQMQIFANDQLRATNEQGLAGPSLKFATGQD